MYTCVYIHTLHIYTHTNTRFSMCQGTSRVVKGFLKSRDLENEVKHLCVLYVSHEGQGKTRAVSPRGSCVANLPLSEPTVNTSFYDRSSGKRRSDPWPRCPQNLSPCVPPQKKKTARF